MRIFESKYALYQKSKKRHRSQPFLLSSPMTMTLIPIPIPIPSPIYFITSSFTTPSFLHTVTIPVYIFNDMSLIDETFFRTFSSYPFWFHCASTLNFVIQRTASGYRPQPEELFLVKFQSFIEVIYIDRERIYNFYIW